MEVFFLRNSLKQKRLQQPPPPEFASLYNVWCTYIYKQVYRLYIQTIISCAQCTKWKAGVLVCFCSGWHPLWLNLRSVSAVLQSRFTDQHVCSFGVLWSVLSVSCFCSIKLASHVWNWKSGEQFVSRLFGKSISGLKVFTTSQRQESGWEEAWKSEKQG